MDHRYDCVWRSGRCHLDDSLLFVDHGHHSISNQWRKLYLYFEYSVQSRCELYFHWHWLCLWWALIWRYFSRYAHEWFNSTNSLDNRIGLICFLITVLSLFLDVNSYFELSLKDEQDEGLLEDSDDEDSDEEHLQLKDVNVDAPNGSSLKSNEQPEDPLNSQNHEEDIRISKDSMDSTRQNSVLHLVWRWFAEFEIQPMNDEHYIKITIVLKWIQFLGIQA